jgi:hypothetical protein
MHCNLQTKFHSNLIPGLATENTKKCYNVWTNGCIISKFSSWVHVIRIHDMIPGFLILPTFQGHIGQRSNWHRCWHVSLLLDLEHSTLV